MKSVKKIISITIVILLNAYVWGGIFNDTISKGNISITISCKGGWIKVSPGDSKDNKFEKKLSGILFCNNRAYVQNENNTWTEKGSISITSFKEVKNKNENDKPGILKILGTGENNFNNIPKVKDILLPYSSDLGIDITEGILAIISEKEIIYVQPNCELFKFYKYDSNNFENEDTSKKRQKKVMESLANDLDAKKQLDSILAHSIIESSLKENNISDLDWKNGKNTETNAGYRIYVPGNLEVNANEYLRNYIKEGPYKANAPVFSSELYSNKNETLENYRCVGKGEKGNKESELLATAAKRYLNWAVEYKFFNPEEKYEYPLYDRVNGIWKKNGKQINNYYTDDFPAKYDSTKDKQEEGNPMPYVKGGVDTPRLFWWKMHIQHNSNFFYRLNNYLHNSNIYYYNRESYLPGTGFELEIDETFQLKYAGCDSLGMLSGIIGMSELEKRIPNINGELPAEKLNQKTKDLENTIKEDIKNSRIIGNEYKLLRYTISDLEKITTVVPTYDEIQLGDLLIRIRGGEVNIAVVIETGTENNDKDKIKVVYIQHKKNGTAVKSTWGQLSEKIDGEQIDISDEFTPRRLLVKKENAAVPTEKYKDAGWDILGKQIDLDRCSIRIGTKMEQGQNQQNDKNWRFIPNTGEYLILGNLTVDLVNSAGVQLNEIYDKEYTVKQLYVKDRSFNDAEGRDSNNNILTDKGNIYVNKADKIKITYFVEGNTEVLGNSTFEVTREKNGNNKTEYYKSNTFGENDIQIVIDSRGKIINIGKDKQPKTTSLSIGIRPESAEHAYPGDDYILGLKVSDGKDSYKIECNEKDYVAVYDKKMLWRANLYIDKKETELGNLDWNDVHLWNTTDTTIEWFGENEWNRQSNFNSNTNNVFYNNLTNLPAGNGGQVVKYNESTPWYYGMADNLATQYAQTGFINPHISSHEKTINSAVAYDYWGWDNPFSYNKKMKEQELLTKQLKPGTNQINNYIQMIFPMDYGRLTAGIPDSIYYSATDDPAFYPKFFDTYTTTPNSNSVITRSNPVSYLSNTSIILHPYLPGLSDSISYKIDGNEKHPKKDTLSKRTAGIDCNGLVQRSCAYKDSFYSALKKNTKSRKEPVYWDSSTNDIPSSVMSYFRNIDSIDVNGNVVNGLSGDNKTAINIGTFKRTEEKIIKLDNGKTETKECYTYFKYLIPGDIIWYDGHIMIVSSIKEPDGYDENNEPYWNDGSKVHILESVYRGSDDLFGVVKTRSLQWLSNEKRWGIWRQK